MKMRYSDLIFDIQPNVGDILGRTVNGRDDIPCEVQYEVKSLDSRYMILIVINPNDHIESEFVSNRIR